MVIIITALSNVNKLSIYVSLLSNVSDLFNKQNVWSFKTSSVLMTANTCTCESSHCTGEKKKGRTCLHF